MQLKYVNQCSCCEKRFIRHELSQWLPGHLEDIFRELLSADVKDLFLRGQYYLIFENGWIAGFYYEFSNSEEELSAEDLIWSVNSISSYLYDSYVSDNRRLVDQEYAN